MGSYKPGMDADELCGLASEHGSQYERKGVHPIFFRGKCWVLKNATASRKRFAFVRCWYCLFLPYRIHSITNVLLALRTQFNILRFSLLCSACIDVINTSDIFSPLKPRSWNY
eukprot:XP_001705196.1 Hypothetical protein GL50803_19325 [Giardia lamblia ATCC 50803]